MPKLPRRNRRRVGPQAAPAGACFVLQREQASVGRVLAIHPGHALANHFGVDVDAGDIDGAERAAVAVAAGIGDGDGLAEDQRGKRLTGAGAEGLPLLGRVDLREGVSSFSVQ